MKFARVELLYLMWVLPLLALAYFYGLRKRRRILGEFAHRRTLARIIPGGISLRRQWRAVLVLSAALLTVISLAGPQYGFQWQKIERRGIDIIIALDCSRSMLAADIQPTRLDRAKREIFDLLAMLQGDRVGLVAFSGTAFLQCPLTIDYPAFYLFLDVLTPDYLPVGGSDLSAALNSAMEAFDPNSPAEKAVILITDGEHTGGDDPFTAAQAAQKSGIKLFCIGVGSADGVPVPETQGGFKKDAAGQIVLSRLDENRLTRMALATGGSYVRSVAGDMDLETIYVEQIRSRMEAAELESGRKQIWADRFQWPLALAVTALFLVRWIPAVKQPLSAVILIALLSAPYSAAHAGPVQQGYEAYQKQAYDQALNQFIEGQLEDPDNPALLYNIGNAYYKTGDYEAATAHYLQALPTVAPELKPHVLYNLGNSAYRQGRLQEAIQYYEAALKLTPDDHQAKENLDFVKKQLQQQKQQQENQASQQDNQDQKKNGEQESDHQRRPPESQDRGEQQPPEKDTASAQDRSQPPKPEEQNAQSQAQKSADQAQRKEPKPQDRSTASQMLNRLKDQPGRAMMPDYQKRPVEKDW